MLGRGRRRGSPTGTRTWPRSRTTTARRTRPSSARELTEAADAVAERVRRGGRRPVAARPASAATATGSPSTRFARYHLHDLVHHAHDVSPHHQAGDGRVLRRATPRSTRDGTQRDARRWCSEAIDRFVAAAAGRVRECSRSAAAPAATPARSRRPACRVRRTDIAPGFVALLRADGYDADTRRPAHRRPGRPGAATRRTTGCGRPPRCSTCAARTSRWWCARLAGATRPGRGAPPRDEGGRRRPVLHPRQRRRAAALHVLARGALRAVLEEAGWEVDRGRPHHQPRAARTGSTCWRTLRRR